MLIKLNDLIGFILMVFELWGFLIVLFNLFFLVAFNLKYFLPVVLGV